MATPTYILMDSVTLGSSTSSVNFTSLDQSFSDLVLVVQANGSGGKTFGQINFNYDNSPSGTNYNTRVIRSDGSNAPSAVANSNYPRLVPNQIYSYANSGDTMTSFVNIFSYSSTDKYKSIIYKSKGSEGFEIGGGYWESNSAITTLTFSTNQFAFASGSTFYLYGIEA
tara:strand:+ start:85 stop:591 length:507 start_codon:yes stop_codon:yes gene_type:complete